VLKGGRVVFVWLMLLFLCFKGKKGMRASLMRRIRSERRRNEIFNNFGRMVWTLFDGVKEEKKRCMCLLHWHRHDVPSCSQY